MKNGGRRPELVAIGAENETNRFLNCVRLTYVIGDEAWQSALLRSQEERLAVIVPLEQIRSMSTGMFRYGR